MKKPSTPFPTTGYAGPAYFCDREAELSTLIRNIKGGNSTTLIALRRMGKTALIRHLFHHLKSDINTIYLDILPTESVNDLLNQFTTAVGAALPEHDTFGKKIWKFIRSLRPSISYDALLGTPIISINSSPDQSMHSISDLFAILESHNTPTVIAIDEFQQILSYPEKKTDAWLRSIIQKLNNVNFLFSGSQQHLMQEIFTNPGRPFFRSTQFLKIGKIPREIYRDFIIRKFEEHKKTLSFEVAEEMLEWADLHTYYVQLLCNRTFLSSSRRIDSDTWKEEANRILKEQEFVFFGYREMLTKPQWELLKAIAGDGHVYQPTSSDFLSRHSLGNGATVLRSIKSLQKMEMVHRETNQDGIGYYGIYDLLFRRWIDKRTS
ncbi:MAG: AAA family ATPase [Bacteroides sp.]|nr:AAA family ATPase [Bacteroides sp.]